MTAFQGLTKKQSVFDNLRQALSIAQPNTTKGLNDTGEDIAMSTIEKRVKQFISNLIKTKGEKHCLSEISRTDQQIPGKVVL